MADVIKLTIVLFIISMVAGLALALTNSKTKDKIAEQNILKNKAALQVVFPSGVDPMEKESNSDIPYPHWIGKKDNNIIGYAIKTANRGYSSNIEFIIGFDLEGKIFGLSILSSSGETPGLGTRLSESISDKYIWNGLFAKKQVVPPWFSEQFKGIDITKKIEIDRSKEWHRMSESERQTIGKENRISALTGATISTRAISDGILKSAGKYLTKLKAKYN
ncbi:MAG: FMN-binding protein [Chitinispirillia bacterium]|jgi:electron transport complex protein RnfG